MSHIPSASLFVRLLISMADIMQPDKCAGVLVTLAVSWWLSLKAGTVTRFSAHP